MNGCNVLGGEDLHSPVAVKGQYTKPNRCSACFIHPELAKSINSRGCSPPIEHEISLFQLVAIIVSRATVGFFLPQPSTHHLNMEHARRASARGGMDFG